MKKLLITSFVIVAALYAALTCCSSTNRIDSDEQLRELIEDHVFGNNSYRQVITMTGTAASVEKNKKYPGNDAFVDDFQKRIRSDVWTSKFTDIYGTRFTEEEITSMLEYRRSDVARKEMELGMEVGMELYQTVQDMVTEITDEYSDATPVVKDEKVSMEITSDNFIEEIQNSELPVVMKVYATWCGPCKILAPMFESLASEYKGTHKFVNLDVDKAKEIASKYNVTSMPTILFIKDGKLVEKHVGILSREDLKTKMKKQLR